MCEAFPFPPPPIFFNNVSITISIINLSMVWGLSFVTFFCKSVMFRGCKTCILSSGVHAHFTNIVKLCAHIEFLMPHFKTDCIISRVKECNGPKHWLEWLPSNVNYWSSNVPCRCGFNGFERFGKCQVRNPEEEYKRMMNQWELFWIQQYILDEDTRSFSWPSITPPTALLKYFWQKYHTPEKKISRKVNKLFLQTKPTALKLKVHCIVLH